MAPVSIRGIAFAITASVMISCGCSLDPIGELYLRESGPFSELVGPYLRITFNPGPDRYPSWSSAGDMIVYSAWGFEPDTQGQITINVIPSTGGTARRVSPIWSRIDYDYYPCWFNGDDRIAYIAFGGLNFTPPLEPTIMIVNANDTQEFSENHLSLNSPIDFGVSPDGSAVAYSDYLTTLGYTGAFEYSEDDGFFIRSDIVSGSLTALWYAELPLTGKAKKIEGTRGVTRFSWSPDSDTLAFSKDGYIYTIPYRGGTAERRFEGRSPAWSPAACASL